MKTPAVGRCLPLLLLLLLWLPLCEARAADSSEPLLFDTDTAESIDLDELVRRVSGARVVIFGERHNSVRDHEAQFAVIRALRARTPQVAVALEVFGFSSQPRLDQFVAGTLSEDGLLEEFRRVSNPGLYAYYRRILLFCREQKIPLVGLRADTDVLTKLFFDGNESLTAEERRRLPGYDPACSPAPRYEQLMRRFASTIQPFAEVGPEKGHLCDFFMGLDSVMGFHAAQYVKAEPGRQLIVLAGIAHSWKTGIPLHLAKHVNAEVAVILPSSEKDPLLGFGVFPSDADFVWWHQ